MNHRNSKLRLCIKQKSKENVPGYTIKLKNTWLQHNLSEDCKSHNVSLMIIKFNINKQHLIINPTNRINSVKFATMRKLKKL